MARPTGQRRTETAATLDNPMTAADAEADLIEKYNRMAAENG